MSSAFSAAFRLLLAFAAFTFVTPAGAQGNSSAPSPFIGKVFHADSFRLAADKALPQDIALDAIDPAAIDSVKRANASGENKVLLIGVGRKIPQSEKTRSKAVPWTRVTGGYAMQWRVTSPEAIALRVELAVQRLSPSVELRFAGSDEKETIYGPFTQADILNGETTYWSPVLHGASAIVEVFVGDGGAIADVELGLNRISHLFVSPADPRAATLAKYPSGSCEVNLICRSASDAALANAGASVAAMSSTGGAAETSYCTGTLLNPLGGSFTPYFYSATHCIGSQATATNMTTHWFYQTTGCTNTIRHPSHIQHPGGGTILYTNASTDGLLLRLNSTPPAGVWYSGWDAATLVTGTALVGVHHPQSDVKKVSLATMGGFATGSTGGSFIRTNWNSIATGVTEPGSSGSGIFALHTSGDYRLRGGLLGGPSSCTAPPASLYDHYSRLDQIYPSISQYLSPPTSTFLLSVSRTGSGTGTVTSSPAGINCGATCGASFSSGTLVSLFASATSGSTFAGWTGSCSGTGSCSVTMSAARSVGATFNTLDDYPDVFSSAPSIGLNSSTPATISQTTDVDWFRFDFPGPGTWTIRTTGTLDTVGTAYAPDGVTVYGSNDDADAPNFRMTFPIGAATTVYLRVISYNNASTGSYTLISSFDDYPDIYSQAPAIALNSSTPATIGQTTDEDWFRFEFPGPGTWTIRTTGSLDTVGTAYAPDGVTVYGSNDDADIPNFRMTFPIGAATTVLLRVISYNNLSTGSYTLVSSFTADDYADVFSQAPIIPVNSSTPANLLSASDVDWFRFDFPGAGDWTVSTTGTTDTIGAAFAPDGATLYGTTDNIDGVNFRLTFQIGAPTTVYLRVTGRGAGNYTLVSTFTLAGSGTPGGSDFNRDGRSDILWRNSSTGQLYRMLMNGFSVINAVMAYQEPNTNWKIVGDGDFNGGGISDLLWRNDVSGHVSMSLFDSNGLIAQSGGVMQEPNVAWKIVGTPDFDGDGLADILWWNSSTGMVWGMVMNYSVIAAQNIIHHEPNIAWKIVATGDFSGSGKKNQLLWRNSTTGQVFLMTATYGSGAFNVSGQMIYQEPNLAWKILAAADFNGDGRTDILWRNDATGQVFIMLMNGAAVINAGIVVHEPNLNWKIVANGDYNGDGRADLLWRNDATGQVYMMLVSGLTITNAAMIYVEPNPAWKILGPLEYGANAGKSSQEAAGPMAAPSTLQGVALNPGTIGGPVLHPDGRIQGSPLNSYLDMGEAVTPVVKEGRATAATK